MRKIDGFLKYLIWPLSNLVEWKAGGCVVFTHSKGMWSAGMTHPQFEINNTEMNICFLIGNKKIDI